MNTPNIPMPDRTTAWSPEQLQIIWAQLESQIHPFAEVLSISGSIWRLLDGGAQRWIADNFMHHVQESVMYCRDGTGNDRYFLGNSRHFIKGDGMIVLARGAPPFWIVRPNATVQTAAVIPPGPPAKIQKPPRPPNAYILYRKDRHTLVKEANPGISNNEISQVLGAAWHQESREVRAKYKAMANQAKLAHQAMHPGYHYQPRKPSERKRRARRGQQIQSSADDDGESMASPDSFEDAEIENIDAQDV